MERIDITKLENKAVLFEIEKKILEFLGMSKAEDRSLGFTVNKNSGEIEKVYSRSIYDLSKNYGEYEKKSEEFSRLFLAYPLYVGKDLDLLEEEQKIVGVYVPNSFDSDMTVYNDNMGKFQYLRQLEDGSWQKVED